jgi:hypothetical protein
LSRILAAGLLALGLMQAAGAEDTDPAYLMSTFREPEQDGLRFAYSHDGYHWTNAPGLFLKARVGGGIMREMRPDRRAEGYSSPRIRS